MISLIRFNDDNHPERIFINGVFVGSANDIGVVIKNTLKLCKNIEEIDIKETSVYVCDDFDEYEEDDTFVDDIWDFFNNTDYMTEEQVKLIQEKNWKELHKEI